MLKTMTGFYDQMHIESPDAQARTIFVDTGTIRATDFNLTDDDRDFLYHNGRAAAEKFLDGSSTRPPWDFDAYVAAHR
jgi:NTE family protein